MKLLEVLFKVRCEICAPFLGSNIRQIKWSKEIFLLFLQEDSIVFYLAIISEEFFEIWVAEFLKENITDASKILALYVLQ